MIVFAADLHLNPLIWQDAAAITGDAYRAFSQVVDGCIDGKASALILGGDIFDKTRPDSGSVSAFMYEMSRLESNDIPVFAIQGQHEIADPPWACLHEYVQCIGDGEMFVIDDGGTKLSVRGYDNASADLMKQAMQEMDPAPDILVIHQLVKQLVPFEGAWDFDLKWVPKETKLVLAGDYHIHANEGKLWYPGSTHMRNISERGQHYYLQIEPELKATTKGRGKSKKTVSAWSGKFEMGAPLITTRPVIECLINDETHTDAALAMVTDYEPDPAVVDADLQPIVYLQYNPQVEGALARVEAACKEKGYHLRTKVTVGSAEVVEGVPQLGSVTLEECLARAVDREKEPEFFSFMLSLLTSEPRPALDAMKKQLNLMKETT